MINEGVLSGQMSQTRRQILIVLKQKGGLTANELAQQLGISAVAVRRRIMHGGRGGVAQLGELQLEWRSIHVLQHDNTEP